MTPSYILFIGLAADIAESCRAALVNHGHTLAARSSVEEALKAAARPDLVVLGPMPPVATLLAVRAIRSHPAGRDAGILVVNEALGADEAAAVLEAGADDCYTRPFLAPIFSARARGVLRRPREAGEVADPDLLRAGPGLALHLARRSLRVDGVPVELSRLQFDLLALLMQARPRSVPAKPLIALVARSVLYAGARHLTRELDGLRPKLGRFGPWLRQRADGGCSLEPPPVAGSSAPGAVQ